MISDALSALSVAAVPVLALTFGVRRRQRRGAGRPGRARRAVRSGGHDGPRDDAARGRRPGRLDAGPRQQRLRGGVQPGLHRRARHRRPADRHARRCQHDVGHRGRVRAVDPRHCGACGSRARASRTAPSLPDGVWAGIIEGLRFVWNNRVLRTLAIIDLAATGLYMPMESVLFPKYFTDRNEPAQLGWVLMALSVGGLVGALGYARAVEVCRAADGHADRGADPRRGDDGHRVPAAAADDPGAVRGRRLRLRADRADLQLRHADPRAAASARPGRRGDGVARLRRGPAGPHRWPGRWPTPPDCTPRSWRCRCRCWRWAWSRCSCPRCATWTCASRASTDSGIRQRP